MFFKFLIFGDFVEIETITNENSRFFSRSKFYVFSKIKRRFLKFKIFFKIENQPKTEIQDFFQD